MKILDPSCGSKMFWFNKSEPHTTYTDIRKETFSLQDRGKLRKVVINPDKIADFTNLPFRDYEFNLIVFDPPHLKRAGENSWLAKKYGKLPKDVWPQMLSKGFKELWRVLALDGILLFKWSDNQIPFKDVLNLFDQQPILGDQCGHEVAIDAYDMFVAEFNVFCPVCGASPEHLNYKEFENEKDQNSFCSMDR